MVNYSFSTILMTFIASNLIIVLITVCFRHEKILLSIGYKLTAVFLMLTILRVLFPFELPFARSIYLPKPLSMIIVLIRHPFFKPGGICISLWTIFELVWMVGFIFKLYKQNKERKSFYRYLSICSKDVTDAEPYRSILTAVCGNRKNPFRLLRIPNLQSPVLIGIRKPCILLPSEQELTPEELYFTFRHETFHHYKRDLITKYGLSLLCMLYWWNPACAKMQKHLHHVLEMRIDDSVAENNDRTAVAYLSSLINIMECLQPNDSKQNPVPANSASLTKEQTDELEQRFHMLCGKRRTCWPLFGALFAIMAGIYIGSYLIIVEANYDPGMVLTQDSLSAPEGLYALPNTDGTYNIYYENIFVEHADTLNNYSPDIPIYKK